MEGDLDTFRGKNAGIVPRTLYHLFDQLEKDDAEYSVRVSVMTSHFSFLSFHLQPFPQFIEIYNEELRDLLSNDENSQKLKIFEDVNRKGSNDV
jgi:kinesin family protein 11